MYVNLSIQIFFYSEKLKNEINNLVDSLVDQGEVRLRLLMSLKIQRLQQIGKSVPSKNHLSFGDGTGFFNILISWHLVFLDGGVDSGLRNLEGILGPCLDIQVRGFLFGDVELFDKVEGSLSEILPIIITEWL